MKTFKIIFFIVFFSYHLVILLLTVNMDSSFNFIFKNLDNLKFGAMFGVLLYAVNVGLFFRERMMEGRKYRRLEKENTSLKVKMFDIEEKGRSSSSNTPQANSGSSTSAPETPSN